MDFATLKSDVREARGGRTDDPSFIYRLVTEEINRDLRLLEMQTETTLTATAESVTLPADFLEVASLYLDADPRALLMPITEGSQAVRHDSSGRPAYYAIHDGELTLMPVPDGSYDLKLRYYAKLADLESDSDTNEVLDTYPSIYTYGALYHWAVANMDMNAATVYGQQYKASVGAAERSDVRSRFKGPFRRRSAVRP